MLSKVLLIDDNGATNFIHTKFLTKAEAAKEVVAFQKGQLALDYLEDTANTLPDLIFVDINMPTMDAWEFLELFKELKRADKDQIKIILLTTSLSPQDEVKIDRLTNVEAIMLKPLNVQQMHKILKDHFNWNA